MQIWQSCRSWLVGITLGAALLSPGLARASEQFPAAMQEAVPMPCAPSCVLCHGEDPGTATTFTKKKLGQAMFTQPGGGILGPNDTAGLRTNYAIYAANPANAAAVADLKAGIDPETKADLCSNSMSYGCGAHVAKKAPPSDWSAVLWVAGAVAFGALVRRKKRAS